MRLSVLSFFALPFMSALGEQIPMDSDYTPLTTTKPLLSDLLTIESSASIFYSYARELELSKMFEDENSRLTVLVPTNKAVMALARKPDKTDAIRRHQGPAPIDEGIEITQEQFDRESKKNVERWVSAHIIPKYPLDLHTSVTYETLLNGKSVEFEVNGDDQIVINSDIRIKDTKEAGNGVIYLIDGTILVD
ncbi:uncharacterized protein EV420DRAFT_1724580 [Desarmillaria tabescens]|uniref:FAS1 domain-containing protein n=1 Tax=Armillaria tabescens TaxID=1929756 RepID=A0AA39NEN7_ARMTA|nr:uncharacterized protein EV420DRAFT_1724580 [Desarmillaria tabescens]KAK0464229.1 hypothetical protein EV420DRAFT_1724580 [Desarmillaria tabescens]